MTTRTPKLAVCALAAVLTVPLVLAGAVAAGTLALALSAARLARPAGRVVAWKPAWQREPAVTEPVVPVRNS